jgi:hypothetical protein
MVPKLLGETAGRSQLNDNRNVNQPVNARLVLCQMGSVVSCLRTDSQEIRSEGGDDGKARPSSCCFIAGTYDVDMGDADCAFCKVRLSRLTASDPEFPRP